MPDFLPAAAVAGAALAAVVYRRSTMTGQIKLTVTNPRVLQPLLQRLPHLRRGHTPTPLLSNGFLQSALVDAYIPPKTATPFVREEISLPALTVSTSTCCPPTTPAGLVSLDWLDQTCPSAPICVLIPSLTGSSDSGFVRRAAAALRAQGVRVGCYNPRGVGGNALQSPFMYNAGYTEDLRRVVSHVHARFPHAPLVAVGFSLGGNYLAKLVAEDGDSCQLAGAAILAAPINLAKISDRLHTSWVGWLIDRYVLAPSISTLIGRILAERDRFCKEGWEEGTACGRVGWDTFQQALKSRRMLDIDAGILAPMSGCSDTNDYYAAASAAPLLKHVKRHQSPSQIWQPRPVYGCSHTWHLRIATYIWQPHQTMGIPFLFYRLWQTPLDAPRRERPAHARW